MSLYDEKIERFWHQRDAILSEDHHLVPERCVIQQDINGIAFVEQHDLGLQVAVLDLVQGLQEEVDSHEDQGNHLETLVVVFHDALDGVENQKRHHLAKYEENLKDKCNGEGKYNQDRNQEKVFRHASARAFRCATATPESLPLSQFLSQVVHGEAIAEREK